MCGLFGWDLRKYQISRDQKTALAAVECAGSDTRGGDSWGYYDIVNGQMHKGLNLISNVSTKIGRTPHVMGHTRKATTGAVKAENSHPFEIGHIIGAHNGMITNHHELNYEYDRNCEVDSEHIFHHIDSGLELDDIHGYGAIEWIDKNNPKRVYLCKLDGGELSIYGLGNKKKANRGVIWSSDEDHILAALAAADITNAYEFEVKTGQVYYVENGMLYKTEKTYSLGGRWGYSGYDVGTTYRMNEYGHLVKESSTGLTTYEQDKLANQMDEQTERKWNELLDQAERQALTNNGEYWGDEESSDSEEFRHTHALNGEESNDDLQKDIDETMREWYTSVGGDPSEFNPADFHPSLVKEIIPSK